MPTILITGSEGNIGTYIVKEVNKKYPDFNLIRVKHKKLSAPAKKNIVYTGNLCDQSFVNSIFKKNKIDYIIHAAARSYDPTGFKNDYSVLANDIQSFLNILNQSQKVKKIIYISSSTLYETSEKAPFTENLVGQIPPPKSPYGIAKFFGERALQLFCKQYDMAYTIWRAFNVVSPLEEYEQGGHVFIDFYRQIFIEQAPEIEIFGSGRQVRCFTWVEDVAQAIAAFLSDKKSDNQIFNLGSTETKTLIELKDLLIQIGKEKNILPSNYQPKIITGKKFYGVDSQLRVPSTEKIKKTLGWTCQTNFKNCFEKFIEYKTRAK